MKKIAIVDKYYNSKINYSNYFEFEFDLFHLSDSNPKRLLKKDITLNNSDPEGPNYFNDEIYDFIILVGAEACKHVGKITSVIKYQGYLVEDKYLPITNPAMFIFKPEGKGAFKKAIEDIHNYVNNTSSKISKLNLKLANNEEDTKKYIQNILQNVRDGYIKTIGLDTETTSLYCRTGYILGICIATSEKDGYYINSDFIDDSLILALQEIFSSTKVVFHNAKFDMKFLEYQFGFDFNNFEDTMLLHYCLDERTGTHDLKSLAIKYTDLGDYDKELETYKRQYCKDNKIKLSDFTYDLIPFNIIGVYAATDPIATLCLYNLFYEKVQKSTKLKNVYENILKKGTIFLKQVEDNGVPFCKDTLLKTKKELEDRISTLQKQLYEHKEIIEYENTKGKLFLSNSVQALRYLFFDILKLDGPGKLTDTGALSTDAEVLKILSEQHELPKLISDIKKAKKIKSTYIDKIFLNLDMDNRLRTGFNLTTTTSGRLSSSGTLNMQQLPRDDKSVKKCIKARKGYKIISQDLKTAEMYIVAVLSKDKKLQKIFIEGGDYHSQMAVIKFKLPYTWQEVLEFHKDLRQEAKTVSFEILYKLNFNEEALQQFVTLKNWLKKQKEFIEAHGYIYSFFGRKRRLPNVFSNNREIKAHEVRSGVNSIVQGPASDVNLLAAIDMQEYINKENMKSKIFALVHDSILAEVPDEEIDIYTEKLKYFTQLDRGLSIPGYPIGIDLEIGSDYSFTE